MINKPRIAYIISHPIQHFCPMFKAWAENPNWTLKVFFASSAGVNIYHDKNFGKEINWGNLYLDKFDHVFLNENRVMPISNELDAPDLIESLTEFNPDVMIVLGYIQKYQRRGLNWAKANGKKILMFSDSEDRQPRAFYKKLLKKIVLPFYLKDVDAFLTIGNANEDYYRNYGVEPTRFFRSSYPIDLNLYLNAFQNKKQIRSEIRDKFKFKEDDIVCSVVGKLVSWKNQKDLINSLEFCKNNKVKLLIIGSGIMMEELKALASKFEEGRVCFSGFVDSQELPAYYAATDIYVHPSRVEPHSVAISEAIFMGCPVLLSNTTGSYGTYDDVRVGINGFVFENGDLKMIAKLIDKLAVNEKLRMHFSNESHSYAVSSQESAAGKGLEACLNAINN